MVFFSSWNLFFLEPFLLGTFSSWNLGGGEICRSGSFSTLAEEIKNQYFRTLVSHFSFFFLSIFSSTLLLGCTRQSSFFLFFFLSFLLFFFSFFLLFFISSYLHIFISSYLQVGVFLH